MALTSAGRHHARVQDLFQSLDMDNDGEVTLQEFSYVLTALGLSETASKHDLKKLFDAVDLDQKGSITFDELDELWKEARRSNKAESQEVKQKKLERAKRLLRMPPPKAAQIILNGIERNKARVLVGNDARILSWLERLMPVNYWRLLAGLATKDE